MVGAVAQTTKRRGVLSMSGTGVLFLAVLIGAAVVFMGLLAWAEKRTGPGL